MSNETLTTSQDIADQLHSAAIHLLRKLRKEDEGSGLNAPRLSALSVIVFGGPITLGDLAAAEQVRPPTMTRIVNALEEQGLVTRKPNKDDGRSTLLSATPAGKKLLMEGRARRVRALAKQIAALSREQRSALQEASEILKAVIRAICHTARKDHRHQSDLTSTPATTSVGLPGSGAQILIFFSPANSSRRSIGCRHGCRAKSNSPQ